MNRNEILGFEYDWLGSDAAGSVGFFSTAGGGAAPRNFLENTDAFDDAIQEILAAPKTTEASVRRSIASHLTDTWKLMAERGIFAFDSDFFGGPYRLIAAPAVPIAVVQFPERVSRLLRLIVVPAVVFRSAIEIDSKGIGD